jgi:hypothetical protein
MKQRLLSLLLLTITFDILSSNGNSSSFYNNKLIKMLLYPFRSLWNSSRATKVTIGAAGALLIGGNIILSRRRRKAAEVMDTKLNEINTKIESLKKSLEEIENNKKANPTLIVTASEKENLETLVHEIETLVFVVKINAQKSEHMIKSDELYKTFEPLDEKAQLIIKEG